MTTPVKGSERKQKVRRWIRRLFLLWAIVSTSWVVGSYRTRGVPKETLQSSESVTVFDHAESLQFLPEKPEGKTALIFFCGGGVSAVAYAPLLRPVAESGYAVFIVKLPWRIAPGESNKQAALQRALTVMETQPQTTKWVIAGHSLGGALACRFVQSHPEACAAMILVGTTHPRQDDLSKIGLPVTKIWASNDGVAPAERVRANRHLLPQDTEWVEIRGGNHSQFGHYGRQLLDGKPTISREAQQEQTRAAILRVLNRTH